MALRARICGMASRATGSVECREPAVDIVLPSRRMGDRPHGLMTLHATLRGRGFGSDTGMARETLRVACGGLTLMTQPEALVMPSGPDVRAVAGRSDLADRIRVADRAVCHTLRGRAQSCRYRGNSRTPSCREVPASSASRFAARRYGKWCSWPSHARYVQTGCSATASPLPQCVREGGSHGNRPASNRRLNVERLQAGCDSRRILHVSAEPLLYGRRSNRRECWYVGPHAPAYRHAACGEKSLMRPFFDNNSVDPGTWHCAQIFGLSFFTNTSAWQTIQGL